MIEGVLCEHGSHIARRKVVEQATIHGQSRRANGLSLEIILREQSYLRAATWKFLTGQVDWEHESTIISEILRLDAAISVATLASFVGFHRREVEGNREWNRAVDELVENWEHTSLVDVR
jgi:hypothetical protein